MASATSRPPQVLIVEDESVIREILAEFLRLDGFDVREAEGGRSALQNFMTERPDLILTDWMMENGNGEELVRSIRAVDRNVPVIVLSANTELTPESLREFKINRLISKPFDPDALIQQIKKILTTPESA